MKVRIGNVWDSTTAVLAGRAGLLMPIALIAFLLPDILRAAVGAFGEKSAAMTSLAAILLLVSIVATVWGQLAMVAVASDPGTTRAQAGAAATARLASALLVTLVLVAAVIVAVLPMVVVLWSTGFDFRAAAGQAGSAAKPPMPIGAAVFTTLYSLVLAGAGIWLGARLYPLYAVILLEGRGIGALGRSVQLTRGLTWKLVGVCILFVIAWFVSSYAAQRVVFIIFRLLLGPAQIATADFAGAIAAAAVTAAFTVIASVSAARLYAAIGDARPPATPDDRARTDLAK